MLHRITYQDENCDIEILEDIVFAQTKTWFSIHEEHQIDILFDDDRDCLEEMLEELRLYFDGEIVVTPYK